MVLAWPLYRLLVGVALVVAGVMLVFSHGDTSVPHPWRIPFGLLVFGLGVWALWRTLMWLFRFLGLLPDKAQAPPPRPPPG